VTILASTLAVEIFFAFFGVTGDLVSHAAVSLAVESAICGELDLEFEELGDIVDVVLRYLRKARHTRLRTAVLDYRTDLFVFFIMENGDGSDEIWRLTAACVFAVAAAAVLFV